MADAPKVLALDIATRTGVAIGRADEAPKFDTAIFAREGDTHEIIFGRCLKWIDRLLDDEAPDLVIAEAYISPGAFMGKYNPAKGKIDLTTSPETTIRLIGLYAIVAAAARAAGIRFERVDVQKARLNFLGVGRLKGPEGKRRSLAMCKALGWAPQDRDQGDAGCVWHYGACLVSPKLAPIITPLLQKRIATTVAGIDIGDADALLKRAAR